MYSGSGFTIYLGSRLSVSMCVWLGVKVALAVGLRLDTVRSLTCKKAN